MSLRGTDLNKCICSPTRSGTVCGKCLQGHSVYYNSWNFKCGSEKYCHLGILFYLLSTIVPLSGLFIVIISFNISFSDGTFNGFILFAQIIVNYNLKVNNAILFLPPVTQLANALYFLYHFFNLEFFNTEELSFCLWKGATAMDMLAVNFVTILFAFALVLFTVFLLRRRKLLTYFPRLFMRQYTLINGLSALFTLCYALSSATCFQILYSIQLFDDGQQPCRTVVFFEGDLVPYHGRHIWYAAVAVVFLIFIVILPPLLLIFYPLFFKFSASAISVSAGLQCVCRGLYLFNFLIHFRVHLKITVAFLLDFTLFFVQLLWSRLQWYRTHNHFMPWLSLSWSSSYFSKQPFSHTRRRNTM